MEDLVNKGEENRTFASLFQDNHNPSKGISLSKVESSDEEVEIELDDVDDNRISYARVLVEVDIAKDLVSEVAIKMTYGNRRIQQVVYENVPKFCSTCEVLGHSLDRCHKNKQVKVNQKEKMADGGENVQPEATRKGSTNGKQIVNAEEAGLSGRAVCLSLIGREKQNMTGADKAEKAVQKRTTPVLVDKGVNKVQPKEKGKKPLMRSEATTLEKRKGSALHIL
ncbi:hypothetical protein M9H77_29745 [Catharanthus roseus]|uniref:Uncharacterized protein n=1 Tax=Catharanthus roseus TaxID=4058 RepID=A0ACB9ZVA0_CATRO|nr:hypothetical protein M9H77_29745 [Catharanthus roseus]